MLGSDSPSREVNSEGDLESTGCSSVFAFQTAKHPAEITPVRASNFSIKVGMGVPSPQSPREFPHDAVSVRVTAIQIAAVVASPLVRSEEHPDRQLMPDNRAFVSSFFKMGKEEFSSRTCDCGTPAPGSSIHKSSPSAVRHREDTDRSLPEGPQLESMVHFRATRVVRNA